MFGYQSEAKKKLINEEVLKAQLKLAELNEKLMLLKEHDHSFLVGDIEKLNYDLENILERWR